VQKKVSKMIFDGMKGMLPLALLDTLEAKLSEKRPKVVRKFSYLQRNG
jgi:hypothetical protein